MSKQEIKFEGVLDVKKSAEYLEDLAKALKNGKICIQEGEKFTVLSPVDAIHMEIEAEQKKGTEFLSIQLSWSQAVAKVPSKPQLKISNQAPAAVKKPVKERKTIVKLI